MDDYKFQQRRKKRGIHCLCCTDAKNPDGTIQHISFLCGCGSRTPPDKQQKKKIVRNALKEDFRRELDD